MRDFSMKLKGKELMLAAEKMAKEVKKGFYLGPFDECPFPSPWCGAQAFVCQLFLIPKHKFIDNGEFRFLPIALSSLMVDLSTLLLDDETVRHLFQGIPIIPF